MAFQEALKQIDEKIETSEKELRYHASGLKKNLSNFDKDFGWMEFDKESVSPDYSYATRKGHFKIK